MSLEKSLSTAQGQVPECVAAGYVDMSTGMLLGIRTTDSHPSEVIELVAAATADMFQGPSVTAIERLFKRARGIGEENTERYFQEILVFSKNLIHVFVRCKKHTDHAVVFVCRANANVGMVLAKVRIAIPAVEEAF